MSVTDYAVTRITEVSQLIANLARHNIPRLTNISNGSQNEILFTSVVPDDPAKLCLLKIRNAFLKGPILHMAFYVPIMLRVPCCFL